MIVIRQREKTVVLTGWRAWLAGIAMVIIAWLLLAFVVFVVIGLTITAFAVLLLIIPAALVAAAI